MQSKNNSFILNISFGYCILIFFSFLLLNHSIPFFWDSAYFSSVSLSMLDSHSFFLIPDKLLDVGEFPLYPLLLKIFYKIFGISLFSAHLLFFIITIGILYQAKAFFLRFLEPIHTSVALLIISVQPILITQYFVMGYDLIATFLFIASINSIIDNKRILTVISITLLSLLSFRGLMMGSFLLITGAILFRNDRKILVNLIITFLVLFCINILWFVYHFILTGWLIHSPDRDNVFKQFVSLKMFFRQIIYSLWKLNDFFNVFIWIPVCLLIFSFRKKIKKTINSITILLLLPLVLYVISMSILSNPIGHKYFLPFIIPATGLAVFQICSIRKSFIRIILLALLPVLLFAGNFLYYPLKYGNGWDSSLKVLPYFSLKSELDNFVNAKKIDTDSIGAEFPVFGDARKFYLNENRPTYNDLDIKPYYQWDFIVLTNVSNSYSADELLIIQNEWEQLFYKKEGYVYIGLYKNPGKSGL